MSATIPASTAAPSLRRPDPQTLLPGFLPLPKAAAWAGVSPRTIRRWVVEGLPTYQGTARGKLLLKPTEIDQYLTQRRQTRPRLDMLVDAAMQELGEKQKKNGRKATAQKRNGEFAP